MDIFHNYLVTNSHMLVHVISVHFRLFWVDLVDAAKWHQILQANSLENGMKLMKLTKAEIDISEATIVKLKGSAPSCVFLG